MVLETKSMTKSNINVFYVSNKFNMETFSNVWNAVCCAKERKYRIRIHRIWTSNMRSPILFSFFLGSICLLSISFLPWSILMRVRLKKCVLCATCYYGYRQILAYILYILYTYIYIIHTQCKQRFFYQICKLWSMILCIYIYVMCVLCFAHPDPISICTITFSFSSWNYGLKLT